MEETGTKNKVVPIINDVLGTIAERQETKQIEDSKKLEIVETTIVLGVGKNGKESIEDFFQKLVIRFLAITSVCIPSVNMQIMILQRERKDIYIYI